MPTAFFFMGRGDENSDGLFFEEDLRKLMVGEDVLNGF